MYATQGIQTTEIAKWRNWPLLPCAALPCATPPLSSKTARAEPERLTVDMTDNNETSLEFELQAAERLEAAGRLDEAAAIYEQLQRVDELLGLRDLLFAGGPLNIAGGNGMIVRPVVFAYE